MFREELHARIHGAAALGALLLGVVFDIAAHEWLAIALSIALVLTAETFNAALEALADALHPGHHPGVGRAKDFAAGAVLWSAIGALAVGIWVFGPHLWRLGQDIIW